jgi:K+-transporting ATPase ATPase A chain
MREVFFDFAIYLGLVLLLVKPLGWYMAQVYSGANNRMDFLAKPIQSFLFRCCKITADQEMNWKEYTVALLYLNFFGILFTYAVQRLQGFLPLNPQGFEGVDAYIAFNTAVSFVTNTDWQVYSGENSLSYFTQSFGLTVQHFLSAATSMCILVALIRSFARQETDNIGNFWIDLIRSIVYILLPLSLIFSIILLSQGVIQNYSPYQKATLIQPVTYQQEDIEQIAMQQTIPMGPVASQVAIKQLGSNGGGFFGTNSAHPFENPTLLSNLVEMLAILLIPAALCYTFGCMIKKKRVGWMILLAMFLVYIPCALISTAAEKSGNPALAVIGMDNIGNIEGKELRFGITNASLWSTATTATSNGSVNSALDSHMPMSTLVYLMLMHIGEIIFGGVGCGLYGMIMMIIIAVFIAGLMVGRSPEYLGKKIEPFEIKMVALVVLVFPLIVLLFSGWAAVTKMGTDPLGNPAAHGFTEILYAFTSMRNNNGTALAGLNASTDFYTLTGSVVMLISRYWMAIAVLAVAGSVVRKKIIPAGPGTLSTTSLTFLMFLLGVIAIVGALSLLPLLALGPIVEHLMLWGSYGH